MVPIGQPAVGAIGAYWARQHHATAAEIKALRALAAEALPKVRATIDGAPWAPNFRLDTAAS